MATTGICECFCKVSVAHLAEYLFTSNISSEDLLVEDFYECFKVYTSMTVTASNLN